MKRTPLKNKLLGIALLFAGVIFITSSCERDDICAEGTATTPHLKIDFYDFEEPDDVKSVRQLSVRGFTDNGLGLDYIYENRDLDSIALPLPFEGEGLARTATFMLEKDSDYEEDEEDEDNPTSSNIDIIKVTYTPEFQYVSRACGYKSIFKNVSITVVPDEDNWIRSAQLLTTTIENETSAHLIFRH